MYGPPPPYLSEVRRQMRKRRGLPPALPPARPAPVLDDPPGNAPGGNVACMPDDIPDEPALGQVDAVNADVAYDADEVAKDAVAVAAIDDRAKLAEIEVAPEQGLGSGKSGHDLRELDNVIPCALHAGRRYTTRTWARTAWPSCSSVLLNWVISTLATFKTAMTSAA
eukprot:jgi/Ulvmu1/12499/UM009_0152.1